MGLVKRLGTNKQHTIIFGYLLFALLCLVTIFIARIFGIFTSESVEPVANNIFLGFFVAVCVVISAVMYITSFHSNLVYFAENLSELSDGQEPMPKPRVTMRSHIFYFLMMNVPSLSLIINFKLMNGTFGYPFGIIGCVLLAWLVAYLNNEILSQIKQERKSHE